MSLTVVVLREAKKEWRPVQSMLGAKQCQLFWRRLFAEHCDRWITGHQLDQDRDQRYDGPHHQDQQADAADHSKQFGLHLLKVAQSSVCGLEKDHRLKSVSLGADDIRWTLSRGKKKT